MPTMAIGWNAMVLSCKKGALREYDNEWISPGEIPNYDFCPADEEILKRIIVFLDESGKMSAYTLMLNPEIIKKDGT